MKDRRLKRLQEGLDGYFEEKVKLDVLKKEEATEVKKRTLQVIIEWLENEYVSNTTKAGIKESIEMQRWDDLVYAFWQEITFGTGGIRGKAALLENELIELASKGLQVTILKGPNTISDEVFKKFTAGVANYMKKRDLKSVVLGYDSRIRGRDFVELIAEIFLGEGFRVHLFDEATPYPELSYAVTYLRADIGIEISASHNDKRFNGYKIATKTGASLNLKQRQEIIEEIYGNEDLGIEGVCLENIKMIDLRKALQGKLVYLGGDSPLLNVGHYSFVNIHKEYLNHIKTFILRHDIIEEFAPKIKIGYSAFYGSGYKLVPWLLEELGFTNLKILSEMNKLDGLFPAFGLTQLPDPGYIGSAKIAVKKFKEEYGEETFKQLDMFIGTDPDADRMGLIVNVPEEHQEVCGEWKLLTANDVWTLVLWYRLKTIAERHDGLVPDVHKKFVVKSHVTTEGLRRAAHKFGVDCIDTWVGFGFLAERIIEEWKRGKINVGAFEESNGFTIGGAKPELGEFLGRGGHTLEKDGTLAAVLVSEICAFAKSRNLSLLDLLNRLYLDPQIGCFVTIEVTLPEEGVFEGMEGELLKRRIIKNIENMAHVVNKDEARNPLHLADLSIVQAEKFATGKYDNIYWPGFPDEGIRFHFDRSGHNHVTIRPSGTEAKLRFYVQLKMEGLTDKNIWEKEAIGEKLVDKIAREAIFLVQSRQF